jgi:hypothetical protein
MTWPQASIGSLLGEKETSRGDKLVQRRQGDPKVIRSSS